MRVIRVKCATFTTVKSSELQTEVEYGLLSYQHLGKKMDKPHLREKNRCENKLDMALMSFQYSLDQKVTVSLSLGTNLC